MNKQLVTSLLLGFVVVLLILVGCKKEPSTSGDVTKPDLIISTEGTDGKTKVFRQRSGLKIEVKDKTIPRVFPKLQGADKMTSFLKEESKKKKAQEITTSYATFTATDLTTYYSCEVDFSEISGDKDFYLVNMNTWVYTYVGSSSTSYLTFKVNRPSMYGNYRVWTEGFNGSGFSSNVYLGDPYTGVSVSSGVLQFSDQAAYDVLYARLDEAYEDHQADFFDSNNSLSDSNMDALINSTGFDEHQPLEEFEAYWGITTLRGLIKGEVDAWLSQPQEDMSIYPEDNYHSNDVIAQTLVSANGEKIIGEGTVVIPVIMGPTIPSNPGPLSCMFDASKKEYDDYGTNRALKKSVAIVSVASNLTNLIGEAKTFKKVAGLYWAAAQRNHYVIAASRTIRSGELTTSILLDGNTYSLTYTH